MAITLTNLLTQVRQRADLVVYTGNSPFFQDPELTNYINSSLYELHNLLVTTYEDYFITVSYFQISSGNTQSVPTDYFKLKGLDVQASDGYVSVPREQFENHNRFRAGLYSSRLLGSTDRYYLVLGDNFYIYPESNAAGIYRLYYIPSFTPLLNGSDTTNLDRNGWIEYAIVDTCIKCAQKQEEDPSSFMAQKEAIKARIIQSASHRDAGVFTETIHTPKLDLDW